MTAVVQERFGSADEWQLRDVPVPAPGEGEVLVRVGAAGLDRGVWHLMYGLPYLVRLAGFGVRRPKRPTPGSDLAGTVEGVGPGVTDLAVGDAVYGIGRGAFAEFAIAEVGKLALRPDALGVEEAAAVPISGITALEAVVDHGRVGPGDRVLVLGASGGVGSFAVQIAAARGAVVTGVCSGAKADLVRALGAERVLDYARDDLTSEGAAYDVIIDIGGMRSLRSLSRLLAERGTLVIVGGENGGRWTGGTHRQLGAILRNPFSRRRYVVFIGSEDRAQLERLTEMIEAGEVRPSVDRVLPLAEAADAMRALEAGTVRGKLVLTP